MTPEEHAKSGGWTLGKLMLRNALLLMAMVCVSIACISISSGAANGAIQCVTFLAFAYCNLAIRDLIMPEKPTITDICKN